MEDAQNKTSLISEKMLKNEIEYFDGKEILLSDLVQNWLTMDLMDEKSCRIVNLEQKFVQKQKEMNQIETEITRLQIDLQAAKDEKQDANGEMEKTEEIENSEQIVEEDDKME